MNTIYQETVRAVDNGAKFKIDFRRRSLKINGTYIIRDGKCDRELGIPPSTENEFFAKMEELYRRYKHSVPSERSESGHAGISRHCRRKTSMTGTCSTVNAGTRRKPSWNCTSCAKYWEVSGGIPRRWDTGSGRAGLTGTW